MKKIKLESKHFKETEFWDWTWGKLKYDIWKKLGWEGFKVTRTFFTKNRLENIRYDN